MTADIPADMTADDQPKWQRLAPVEVWAKEQAMRMQTLEQRCGAALTSEISSTDLAALLDELESAIGQAYADAEAQRQTALDPVLSPNAEQARATMDSAAFLLTRLEALHPRLEQRWRDVKAAEHATNWEPKFQEVQAKRDVLAAELREVYPEVTHRLADLFHRIEAADKEVSRINGSAPSGDHRRLLGVELTGRGLDSFTTANPSIAKTAQIPDWAHSDRLAWPPPQPSLAEFYAMSTMPQHDPRYSADWGHALKKDNARRQEAEERWDKEEAARRAESRRSYEASLRR